jgi:hypothetical protein
MGRYITKLNMHKYISTLTHIKDNPSIGRIDNESVIDVKVISELHEKGFIDAIDFSNKSYSAFGDISITIGGLSFLDKQRENTNNKEWYKKPIGLIFITVFSAVLVFIVKYLLQPYLL